MQCCRLLLLDSKEYESSLKEGLLERNIEIIITSDEEEALHLIQEHSCLAMLWDAHTITKDTLEYIEILKAANSALPIILLADNDSSNITLELFSLEVFAFLKKPANCVELLELIQSALDIAEQGDGLQILSATSSWIEVNIPAQTSYIPRLSNWVGKLLLGFSERDHQRLVYAFRELVQNAIEHGSQFCASKKVKIQYLLSKRFLCFQIEDEGNGFKMNQIPHAAIGYRSKNAAMEVMLYRKRLGMRPGGLGIVSVQSIADELIYNQKGNCVALIKYLPTEPPSLPSAPSQPQQPQQEQK